MSSNGLITKIWGPALWTSLHCITFGYPIEPTDEQKKQYKNFFKSVGNILPCKYCRDSYNKFIKEEGSILNNSVLENRDTLSKWLYNLHNKVNDKLGMDYGVDYNTIRNKYESYRAKCSKTTDEKVKGCVMPLYKKNICYKEVLKKDCPIIDFETGKILKEYANKRGIKNKNYYFWNIFQKNNGKIKRDEIWDMRNKYCNKIINYMRENGIPSIEPKGKYKNLPTKLELRLMLALSTNLSKDQLNEIIIKLKNI